MPTKEQIAQADKDFDQYLKRYYEYVRGDAYVPSVARQMEARAAELGQRYCDLKNARFIALGSTDRVMYYPEEMSVGLVGHNYAKLEGF